MKARGTAMMMVGYALNHHSGTYEFYNPNTDNIIISNSAKWKYFNRWEYTKVDDTIIKLLKNDEKEYSSKEDNSDDEFEDKNNQIKVIPTPTIPIVPTRTVINESKRITRSQSNTIVKSCLTVEM